MCVTDIDRRRRRKPGDLGSLRRSLWASIVTMEEHIGNEDPAVAIKAAHALATLAGSYLRAIEMADVQVQIRDLQAAIETGKIREIHRSA